jgi:hypothetical protein
MCEGKNWERCFFDRLVLRPVERVDMQNDKRICCTNVLLSVPTVKLPQPQPRTRTYTQTCQSTLRSTQVRASLSHAYAVTYQNRITDKP